MSRTASPARARARASSQRGRFAIGFVAGGVAGVLVSVGVALWVNKVPVPFVDKVPHRTPQQDAAEAERNRRWDPNAGLNPKASAPAAPVIALPAPGPGRPAAAPPPAETPAAAAGTIQFYVQVGAFARADDAEQQRAKLAMLGFEARVSAREQSGRTMHRVRLGPYERRGEAEGLRDRLADQGVEAALVRVQQP